MAQSGYTPILIYASGTAAAVPSAANLTSSANGAELALNYADGKLYYKNSSGVVTLLASAAAASGTSPGGSNTQVQYNNAGAFAGSANFVWDNSNVRLGIGTSSPATKLDVRGTPGADYGIANIFDTTSAASGVGGVLALSGYKTTTSGAAIFAKIKGIKENATAGNEAGALTFETNSGSAYTERMRIDSSGNMLMGTTSNLAYSGLVFNMKSSGSYVGLNASSSEARVFATWDTTAIPMTFYMGGTERMRINSSGNVGIGTSSPTAYSGYATLALNGSSGGVVEFQRSGAQKARIAIDSVTDTLIFNVANANQMIIDSSGNVGIGVTPPTVSQGRLLSLAYSGSGISVTSGADVSFTNNAYYNTAWKYGQSAKTARLQLSDDLFIFYNATTGTAGNNITFSERMRISAAGGLSVGTTADPGAGAIYATGNITAYYSDARLKDVKGTIANALDKVSSLSGVYYTNNEVAVAHGYTSAETQVGLLAQDVEAVLPEVVKAAPFDLDEKGNSKSGEHYKTVQYERIIPLLVEAIKELRAEVKALRGE
jgi:hypothetical protein